jgi:hypothetical protein
VRATAAAEAVVPHDEALAQEKFVDCRSSLRDALRKQAMSVPNGGIRTKSTWPPAPEVAIVLGVDPEHRQPRALAEAAHRLNQPFFMANFVVGPRSAAAGKADARDQALRRVGGERDGGEAARRLAGADDP